TRCYRDWSSDVCSSDLVRGPQVRGVHATVAVRVAKQFHHAEGAGLRGAFELLVRLHTRHLRIELASLVKFLDVELACEIVPVQRSEERRVGEGSEAHRA